MKLPTLQEAETILLEAEPKNPGSWVNHSRLVADAAKKVAELCKNINPEEAYILGLLHDIGRRSGFSHFRHIVDGYRYMNSLGFPSAARICLTHSFQYQDILSYMGIFDVPEQDKHEMEQLLFALDYNDYDRLIQLCDCLCGGEGVVMVEQRLVDVVLRYGFSELTVPKWKAIFELKKYFEEKTNKNVYEIISEDRSLWGK